MIGAWNDAARTWAELFFPELIEKLDELTPELVATVRVDATGATLVNRHRISDENIASEIATRITADDRIVISLVTEEETRCDDFVWVLGQLEEAGASRIAISDPVSATGR